MTTVFFLVLSLSATLGAASSEDPARAGLKQYYRGDLDGAARSFLSAARRRKNDAAPYLDAAIVYQNLDNHSLSLSMFEEAAKLEPGRPDIQAALGWAATRAGELPAARAAFDAALGLDAGHAHALLGSALLDLRTGERSSALETLNLLIKTRPDYTLAFVYKARALEALGLRRRAIAAYAQAFKSDPTYSEVRLWLGALYARLRRYDHAWRQYAKVLQVRPGLEKARAELKRLEGRLTRKPQEILPPRRQKRHLEAVYSPAANRRSQIRVGVGTTSKGQPAAKLELAFISSGEFEVRDTERDKLLLAGPALKVWLARRIRSGRGYAYELVDEDGRRRLTFSRVIALRPREADRHSLIFQRLDIADGTAWAVQGDRQLKGTVELRGLGSSGLYLINELPLEDYLYGVVNEEMPAHFPEAALMAQAIVARNHALFSKRIAKDHRRHRYDLCDGQHCQVYGGVAGESERGRLAVDATRGLVLRFRGKLAQTPYSSNCGGHTQDSGEVKNWFALDYLHGRKDVDNAAVDQKSPWELDAWLKTRPRVYCNVPRFMHPSQFRMTRVIEAGDLGDRIRSRAPRFGLLRSIRILRRSKSGNVNKIEFRGTRGRCVIEEEQAIRGIMGLGSIRSTMFTLETDRDASGAPTNIFLYGGGWGHGVGLCQLGAAGRALDGQSYREILAHYLPGTEVGSLED